MSGPIPESKPDILAIFTAAAACPSAEDRAKYLDEACGSDPHARARVETLLRAHFDAGNFLGGSPPEATPTVNQPLPESPGSVIGPYKLLQKIGEGGMGVVYMADQTEPVERRVALKIIKPGMDTRQVIARFEAERQALAMMDHPNIARVLDAGATDSPLAPIGGEGPGVRGPDERSLISHPSSLIPSSGRPFFVMELVKGLPITQYCDEQHLTPRERLELFLPVCQAVQHAHQKGIIHRDLKPSNILVARYDDKAVPKIIDFGVAKAVSQRLTERTMFTQYGQIVGTVEYMSPEQAQFNQLDVDTRSDIYSLGVLLYELLTGETPFDKQRLRTAAFDELLRIIREEEPPRPSTRLSSSETLPSIAANRHTEPKKLTTLVRGELDWIVMKALEKDRARRYETASAFAADVQRYLNDEAVLACSPSAAYRFRKFARRNRRAVGMIAVLATAGVIAATSLGWALRDRQTREQGIALETARKHALTEEGIRQALDRGAKRRAELLALLEQPGGVQQLLNQPARWELSIKTARSELAQARHLADRAEGILDAEWTQAIDQLEQQLTSDQEDFDLALRLENIRTDSATWVEGWFDLRKPADEYPQAFGGFAVPTDDPAVVAARICASPIKDQLVAALDHWAWITFYLRQEDLTEQLLAVARQAAPEPDWGNRLRQLKVWRDQEALGKLVGEAPAAGLSPQLLDLVGFLLGDANPLRESWMRRAQAEYPADFWLNFNLAGAIYETNPVEAAGFYRVALAVRPGISAVYNNLGNALRKQQQQPEALAAFRKAIELDPKNARAHISLGTLLCDQQKDYDGAIACFNKAVEIEPKNAGAHHNLGIVLLAQRKLDDSIAAFHKAIELDPKDAHAHSGLGSALRDQGKIREALPSYAKAVELDPKNAAAWDGRGWLHMLSGQLDDALADNSKAIELEPKERLYWNSRSVTYLKLGQLDQSLADSSTAIELDPKFAGAWFNRGEAHRRLGRHDLAAIDYRTAIELKTLPPPDIPVAHRNLAIVLNNLGDNEEARKQYEVVVGLAKKAVELAPNASLPWQTLGWALYDAGTWNECIEALEKSCKLQHGGTGDCGQWIVLALAHGKLANETELSEPERSRHMAEARRWYDQAVTQIDSLGAGDGVTQAIREFRLEAAELLQVDEQQE